MIELEREYFSKINFGGAIVKATKADVIRYHFKFISKFAK